MLLYIFIGAIIGGFGGFLIAYGRRGKTPLPPTSQGPESGEQKKPRRRLSNLLGTALMGVAVGGFVGYMVYDFRGFVYKRSEQIIEIKNEKQFEDVVLNSDKPVLVEFYTQWCTYCHQMIPTISEIADEYKGRAVVVMVDAEALRPLAEKYEVRAYPVFFVFRKGEVVVRFDGAQDKQVLMNALIGP